MRPIRQSSTPTTLAVALLVAVLMAAADIPLRALIGPPDETRPPAGLAEPADPSAAQR